MSLEDKTAEITRELVIINEKGLHLRAATKLANLAKQFESDIIGEKDGESVNAKEVLTLMALECPVGSQVLVKATGSDAALAVKAVIELVENKFGE